VIEITGDWRHQGLGRAEKRGEEKMDRSGKGSPRARRNGSGWKMAGGDVDGRVGPLGAAALRWTPGDEERLRRCSATSWTSWRGLIASEDSGRDELATAARWPAPHGSVGAGDGGSGARRLEQGLGNAAHGLHVL
jgi:hypothetical protein